MPTAGNFKMKNIIFNFLVLVSLLFLFSSVYAQTEDCSDYGCSYSGDCYLFGDIVNTTPLQYCDINGSLSLRKGIGESCLNDFECIYGACLSDYCANITSILTDYSYLENNFGSGPCGVSPGCLNVSSISNGKNISGFCINPARCFSCDENYEWNGSSCNLINCSYHPGCLNESSFDNAIKVNRACIIGKNCFKCDSGFIWRNNSCMDTYYRDDTPTYFWLSTFPVSENQFKNGFSFAMKIRQRLKIVIQGEDHYVGIVAMDSSKATINVSSAPQQAIFRVHDNKKFEVNGDNDYDLGVILNSIKYGFANVTIYSVDNVINQSDDGQKNNNDNSGGNSQDILSDRIINRDLIPIIIAVIAVIMVVVVILIVWNVLKNKRRNEQSIKAKEVWKDKH